MREIKTNVQETGRKAPDGRKLERVTLGFELKSLSDDGTFTGYLSAFGNEDSYGDVVDPGAFTKTIAERSADNPLPFLWQHYTDEPIGVYTRLAEEDFGLYTEGKYAMGVQRAREAYELAKMRAVKGQSIGFTTIKDVIDAGVRRLKELKLWEGSQVTFPANDLATITGVKSQADMAQAIEKLAALCEQLKGAIQPGDLGRIDDSSERAAVVALADEIRGALGPRPEPRSKSGEPDDSTRADQEAVAEMRREMRTYLAGRVAA